MFFPKSKPVFTVVLNMAATNVTVGTSVQLSANVPSAPSQIEAYNGGANPLILFAGPAGTKQLPITIPPGLSQLLPFDQQIGVNDILNVQALVATNSTGALVLNFFG